MTSAPDAEPVPDGAEVPDVTVVIPAYNALPYLHRCLDSVVAQTMGLDRMEVIAVDDGSTDGTGAALDSWAQRYPGTLRVVHFAVGSGGPAGPRNAALDLATGRYVFFLDADDHLGPEALERLVAAADENGSDVVAGQMATSTGRGLPTRTFRRTQLDADLATSGVYWTLSALKLFRRRFLEEHRIRFPTEFPILSDQPFTALAYFRARRISVLAGYDFYFAEWRDDGRHVTRSGSIADRIDVVEAMCAMVLREVADPTARTRLLHRHLQGDLWRVMRGVAAVPREDQDGLLDRVAELLRGLLAPDLAATLTPDRRLVFELCRRGLVGETLQALRATDEDFSAEARVEDGRAYAVLPFFRDAALGLPDELYEMTDRVRAHASVAAVSFAGSVLHLRGTAVLRRVPQTPSVTVVLRHLRRTGLEHAGSATVTGEEFDAAIDLGTVADGGPLPGGTWTVHVQVAVDGVVRTSPLAPAELSEAPEAAVGVVGPRPGDARLARALLAASGLAIQVGRPAVRPAEILSGWQVFWEGTDLIVRVSTDGRVDAPVALELVDREGGARRAVMTGTDGHLSGRLSATDLSEGPWTARLRWGGGPGHVVVPVPARDGLGAVRWRQAAHAVTVTPATTSGPLVLQVGRVGVGELARGLVRRRR